MSPGGDEGGLSRRSLLERAATLGAAGATLGAAGPLLSSRQARADARTGLAPDASATGHQAGIATPRPASLALAGFDVRAQSVAELTTLLKTWSAVIAELVAARPAGSADSGETLGLPQSALTITVGLGPGLFGRRFGLAAHKPFALADLPAFPDEQLERHHSGGDLVVQACAAAEGVAMHAVRQLARLAGHRARLRWLTAGFASAVSARGGASPRNILGFRDGSADPPPGSPEFDRTVWVRQGPDWLRGGTYLCYRKIRVDIAAWDALGVPAQQAIIGRVKRSGAPLSGGHERSPIDLRARTHDGALAIPAHSHVRMASPELNGGARMFRRSFAYVDGARGDTGTLDAGQLFLAFVADPGQQFIPVLANLMQGDRLVRFTTHVATGLWALPPAPAPGGWLGDTLLA